MNIEKKSAYYTAVGHFRRRTDGTGRSYPIILVDQEEDLVDIQEMALWAVLNWRFLRLEQIKMKYRRMERDLPPAQRKEALCLAGAVQHSAVPLLLSG